MEDLNIEVMDMQNLNEKIETNLQAIERTLTKTKAKLLEGSNRSEIDFLEENIALNYMFEKVLRRSARGD